ncbi:MAG TPA: pitrilysin family protein [Candidatus Limnocylindrales bacterium]
MTEIVVAERPTPGHPRPYAFPEFERDRLPNGLSVITVPLPGRPLVTATLVLRNGAVDEPAGVAGATVLAARALPEGTEQYDAIALVEASERLGASLHAETSWDAMSAGVEVIGERLDAALELLAEMVGRPTFPDSEVERLRDERLNDILQARADPRRRAEEAFVETIYTADSPYHRPASGLEPTVAPLDAAALRAAWQRGMDPATTTLVVGGDLTGLDVRALAERLFGGWTTSAGARPQPAIMARPALDKRLVRLVHRPESVQTEIRIGHPGLPRRIPDYHALSVMTTILGGLFNSRLNMNLREEKGYTYGANAGFDLRRAAGPFAARAAVNTEVTVPAIREMLRELERMRDEAVTDAELRASRDYLIGVFPLRFETPGPVVGSIAGLVVHGLPDDELARYRDGIEAVNADDVRTAARAHLHIERAGIVLVGDAERIAAEVEAGDFGPLEVVRDEVASPA